MTGYWIWTHLSSGNNWWIAFTSINYINLTTAKAAQRAREIGVRRIIGAAKQQLFFQFISESFIIFFLAMVVSVVLIKLLFPMYNSLTGKDLSFNLFDTSLRKVLGASVSSVTGLLAKDFISLVIIAILIASPIGWYFMDRWLLDFAYRMSISWWVFPVAGVFILLVAVLTISFQAIKAALTNPIKSLRTE